MSILRRIVVILAVAALGFFLWVLSIDVGVVHEIGQPEKVKKVLADSGLYQNLLPTVLDQAGKSDQPSTIKLGGQDVKTNDPIIKTAANDAFPPSFIQSNVEQIIDSFNDWLNGKTDKPNFRIDLTQAKATFAKDLGTGIQARLAGLPACTDNSTAANFNAFDATCLPKGVTAASAAAAIQNDAANSQDLFKQTVYTADDMKDDKGQSVFKGNNAQMSRNRYERLKGSPIALAIICLALAAAIIFLSSTKARGFRRVGIILVINGLIILGLGAAFNSAINRAKADDPNASTRAFQESAITAGKSVIKDLNKVYYPLGWSYAGIGLALILGSFFLFKNRGGSDREADEPAPRHPSPFEDEPEPETNPLIDKPKPQPKKTTAKPKKPTTRKIKIS